MDYFVSADVMEHPYRSRMPVSMEPYTEQVILLEGQGIWYYRPEDSEQTIARTNTTINISPRVPFSRQDFGYSDSWCIFFVPQSVFKMHPLFDSVLAEILARDERIHVVVTGGRRPRWSDIYEHRLFHAVTQYNASLLPRIHMIPRVSSEKFIDLLQICDVVLHPFPFDGSRTSADALIAGKPFVTLPSEYLRGRMGQAFLRTMNLPELVAHNRSEYVAIATRLATDRRFYENTVEKIKSNLHLIWEDIEVPYEWTNLLSTVAGLTKLNWHDYLSSISADKILQDDLRNVRKAHRADFARVWGQEEYLLHVTEPPQWESTTKTNGKFAGLALLEEELTPVQIPMIFNNWKSVVLGNNPNGLRVAAPVPRYIPFVDAEEKDTKVPATAPTASGTQATRPSLPPLNLTPQQSSSPGNQQKKTVVVAPIEPNNLGAANSVENEEKANIDKDAVITAVRAYASRAQYDQAYAIARRYGSFFTTDPLFIFEYGAIQFFRSDYKSAFEHCAHVIDNYKEWSTSVEAYACAGVSAMYLGGNYQNVSIKSLATAWKLNHERKLAGVNDTITDFIFRAQQPSIEFNLISALATFKRRQECVSVGVSMASLPPVEVGGAHIAIFAAIDWANSTNLPRLQLLEQSLRREGKFQLPDNVSLWQEIHRMQRDFSHVLNPYIDCLCDHLSIVNPLLKEIVIGDLMGIVDNDDHTSEESAEAMRSLRSRLLDMSDAINDYILNRANDTNRNIEHEYPVMKQVYDTYASSGLTLITQHFSTAKSNLTTDMSRALQKNLNNPAISQIYLLNEERFNYKSFDNNWKIRQFVVNSRLTFEDAFEFANVHLANKTVALGAFFVYSTDMCQI
jgi:hypothetical protein